MLAETRERGLLIGKGGLYGHTLRMAPPMNVSEADAKEGLGILADALRAVTTRTRRDGTAKHASDAPEARRSEHQSRTHWIGGQPWDGAGRAAR